MELHCDNLTVHTKCIDNKLRLEIEKPNKNDLINYIFEEYDTEEILSGIETKYLFNALADRGIDIKSFISYRITEYADKMNGKHKHMNLKDRIDELGSVLRFIEEKR